MAQTHRKNRATALFLFTVAGGMVGLAFASVPLYQLFCQVTGFGGTPRTEDVAAPSAAMTDRTITVRFDANVNPALKWRFRPEQPEIRVRAGEPRVAYYRAVNRSAGPLTGTATFNVTPYKAGLYFSKTECFCFMEQHLAAGETARMGVEFFVDPEIFNDPNTRDITTITLSYTFFRATDDDSAGKAKQAEAPVRPAGGLPKG